LEALAENLQLADRVDFCGRLEPIALRDLLRRGDLYVLPSIGMEAFSISALEAAGVGLPLVLSDQVGLGDFLTKDDFASYPARDVGALAATLRRLYDRRGDPEWTDRAARHGRMREQFSAEQVARQLLDLI
jgi:glycosyltransferase involved in cell wall biosynthesis